jgi:hypothetical protein
MLECQALLIGPADVMGRYPIVDTVTGAALGHARWRHRLAHSVLEVREAEDEPLVFTMRRGCWLFGRRVVCDAEGQVVGVIGGSGIHCRWGARLAAQGPTRTGESRFRGSQGQDLAVIQPGRDVWRVTFSGELEGEPFVKMLVLAAALAAKCLKSAEC